MFRRSIVGLLAGIGLVATFTAIAPAASAAARDGICQSGEFCYYYNSGNAGSLIDFSGSRPDLGDDGSGACYKFISSGNGRGQCVKNNAASFWNRTSSPVTVFYNSDYGGIFQRIPAGGKNDFRAALKNNNAGHLIGDSSLRFPLATTQTTIKNQSPLTWCYNSDSNCHHDYNAADIFAPTGTHVVSPVVGTVMTVHVRAASTDCTSVGSTVTVKDGYGRLWYFAHMDDSPGPQVSAGQSVSKGTLIGYVGTKYHALCTQSHLHIDMRWGVNDRVECSAAACASYGFVNNQPLLREAFGNLAA